MSRELSWSDLKIGLLAFVVLFGGALGVLFFARVGALHGKTSDVYVVTDEAPGVIPGTEVWLSGQKVGLVKDVHFREVTTDTLFRLAIHLEVLSRYLNYVRRDAWADIRPGDNLIGSSVVWISSGTSKAGAIQEGDTLEEIEIGKLKPVSARVSELGNRLEMLADSSGKVLALLKSQAGTAGKLVGDGWPKITNQTDQIARLAARARSGEGSLGLMLNGELGAHIASIRATKDTIVAFLNSDKTNVGRFRRDSSLMKEVSHLQLQLDSIKSAFSGGNGIGRMRSDSTLRIEMTKVRAELTALMADLRKRPLRYINP